MISHTHFNTLWNIETYLLKRPAAQYLRVGGGGHSDISVTGVWSRFIFYTQKNPNFRICLPQKSLVCFYHTPKNSWAQYSVHSLLPFSPCSLGVVTLHRSGNTFSVFFQVVVMCEFYCFSYLALSRWKLGMNWINHFRNVWQFCYFLLLFG